MYLQVTDPSAAAQRWECFTSYRLCIENQLDPDKTIMRDSWHRFSPKKKSHGWCDFTPAPPIMDRNSGFCIDDAIVVSAEILLLKEECHFVREADASNGTASSGASSTALALGSAGGDALSGKFTWKVRNISSFMEVMNLQKIMSPVFPSRGVPAAAVRCTVVSWARPSASRCA